MELLGVITLLALISLIIIMSVNKSLKDSKETLYQAQIEEIKAAADMWKTDNIELIPNDDYYIVSLQQLQDEGYIKGDITNPKTDEPLDKNMLIEIGMNEIRIGDETIIAQRTDNYISQEIQAIKDKLLNSTPDGIYYYNNQGNLENGTSIIYPERAWNRPKGNVLIHNHQFISGCIQINGINYDIYKTTITQQDYPCSTIRGENLIVNGDLSFKDNTNFSGFTYVSEEGTNGYLTKTVSSMTTTVIDRFVPVDANKKYEIGFTAKSSNPDLTYYIGLIPYNENREQILSNHVMYIGNTLTTLSRDLNTNDKYVYLTDITNWKTDSKENQPYFRGFIFWNYVDSTGYTYPELTYSKTFWKNLYKNENIDKENNRIELDSPWAKESIPAGTKLSQSSEGASWLYALRDNKKLTENYETYSATIQGTRTTGTNRTALKFDPGTKYVKFSIRQNVASGVTNTIDFKDIYLREVIE